MGSISNAKIDGIKMIRKDVGNVTFEIPCQKCGKPIYKNEYSRARRYLCDYCKKVLKKKQQLLKEIESVGHVKTNKEKAFDKAVANIQSQVKNFQKYDKVISIAQTRCECYGSIPEAMVAIELLKLGYKIIPQQKVGKYKVDFAIPQEKMVIEVDGEMFHRNKQQGERNGVIQLILGLDWKIIHIPAELISGDIIKLKTVLNKFGKVNESKAV